jgi:hypothetical protein
MRIVDPQRDASLLAFAKRAHAHFAECPNHYSYTDQVERPDDGLAYAAIRPGELLALRWNEVTVLVLRVSDVDEVLLYDESSLQPKMGE